MNDNIGIGLIGLQANAFPVLNRPAHLLSLLALPDSPEAVLIIPHIYHWLGIAQEAAFKLYFSTN